MEVSRILVFQTAFLGDLILTSPLIKSLRKTFRGAKLTLVVRKGLGEVFKGSPFVNEILEFDKKANGSLVKRLRRGNFDLAVSPHRSHRTSLILFLSRIKRRIGFDVSGFSFLYTDRVKYRRNKGIHEIDRNLSLLSPIKEAKVDSEPTLPVTDEEVEVLRKKFNLPKDYVVIAPGSVWKTKAWLPEYYGKVGDFLEREGFKVVIVGSKNDLSYCVKAEESMSKKPMNLCGKTTVREFLGVIKGAKLVVSNDSAPVHGAVSFNVPVVEIYGSTLPEFGFYPYRNGVYVEPPINLECRPCGIHGKRECPEGHFMCMRSITPEMVISQVERFLQTP